MYALQNVTSENIIITNDNNKEPRALKIIHELKEVCFR